MSLVTRCPACATPFKVVRDQLRISDGWVRCGRCSEVFDATVDLQEVQDATAMPGGLFAASDAPIATEAAPAPGPNASQVPGPSATSIATEEVAALEDFPEDRSTAEVDALSSDLLSHLPELGIPLMQPASRHEADGGDQDLAEADFFDDEQDTAVSDAELDGVEAVAAAQVSRPAIEDEAEAQAHRGIPGDADSVPPASPLDDMDAFLRASDSIRAAVPQLAAAAPYASIVPDEPWPDSDLLGLHEEGRAERRPPAPPPLAFPDIDLSLTSRTPSPAGIAPSRSSGAESDGMEVEAQSGDSGFAQLQKALRRARVKSAKIAKARSHEEQGAGAPESAPVVLAASEAEAALAADMLLPTSFSADAGTRGFWRRPGIRRALILVGGLAVLLLLAQVARQERDLILARQPALRPALAALCKWTGCELHALRQISKITIDGAAFAREKNGDAYRLDFTLRNAGTVPLEMPAVELSLLDTQERTVVRRVLMPADFGAPTVLAARAERTASLPLSLSGPEAAVLPPIAGYRVVAFYP